jgi:excisionase family DNA binding protein
VRARRGGSASRGLNLLSMDENGTARRETLTVEEAGRILGLGRAAAYAAVRRGEIPSLRFGRRVLVPRQALDRMLAGASR